MANHLDLEEQEQLDQLKHFWRQYGNLITWALIAVLTAFASWNFYQYWQRSQAVQAAAMYDEVERVVAAGDSAKIDRALADITDRFASTTYAPQAGLLVAKQHFATGNLDAAGNALRWVVDHSKDPGYQAIAKLRLAGVLMDRQSYDDALKVLSTPSVPEFEALQLDRQGDIYLLQGNKAEAIQAFKGAYDKFAERTEYRRLVEVKLNALGVDPLGSGLGVKVTSTSGQEGSK